MSCPCLPLVPCWRQAALQGKRQELRASVAEGLRGVLARAQEASARGEEQAVWVHQGFLQAYQSVRTEVLRLLETALAGALGRRQLRQPLAGCSADWQQGDRGNCAGPR